MGVIETLSKGFHTVSRHWWLILIPVLLDTFLWLGPRASVEDLVEANFATLEADLEDMASAEATEWFAAFRSAFEDILPRYNAFSALRVGALGVPSLIIWGGARFSSPSMYEALWVYFLGVTNMPDLLISVSEPRFMTVPVWQIANEGTWLLTNLSFSVLGVLIGSAYLTLISKSLSDETPAEETEEQAPPQATPPAFWRRAARLAYRFVLFWLLRAVVLIALGIPFLLVLAAFSLISPGLGALFGTVALGLLAWLSFYGAFFVAALVMNNTTVWWALWNSFSIIMRNFWSTLWLYVLINLIGGGLTILWQQLSNGSWWTWIAIVGNAYVGTSLVAASLAFYHDRYTRWREAIGKLLSESQIRAT